MALPHALLERAKQGKVVLFLGSGALFGAKLKGDKEVILGNDLRDLLADRFLGGEFKEDNLAHVAELAQSQTSLAETQDYIKDLFDDIEPADFHLKIPEFNWRAIFTTNYDRLIETCYERNPARIQRCKVHYSNQDNLDESRTTNDIVPIFKLHGCITRTHDENLPLILTIDQYNDHKKNRKRLFDYLYQLAYDATIVFIGHSLLDQNIRAVMMEVFEEVKQGQIHYFIKPGLKEAETQFWAQRRITAIDNTFEDFINELEHGITKNERALTLVKPSSTHSITKRFSVKSSPSEDLIRFLTESSEHIHQDITYQRFEPKDFYRGSDLGWYPVAEGLNANRQISTKINDEIIKKPESERKRTAELYLIKGAAGSGKSIVLREIAWKCRSQGIGTFLWIKNLPTIDISSLKELHEKTKERLFLFWDDAAINSTKIQQTIRQASNDGIPITIITAERFSDWNSRCENLDELVVNIYEIGRLSHREISDLVDKLELYNCLGPNLAQKNRDERIEEFSEKFERQLLVALYEATMGKTFEEIIYDEYQKISPPTAQAIYRTICTLNRLRVPVRAGLIARIHDIGFDSFKERFQKPLEQVVLWTSASGMNDAHYKARHPEIADIVFRTVLTDSYERYNEYIRILDKINISFESDNNSYRSLIRAKTLTEIFPNYDDVASIYDKTCESIGKDPYLLQQMAIFERIRKNGSIEKSIEILLEAKDMAPYDSSILHSLAVAWRDRARHETDLQTRSVCRAEARSYIDQIRTRWGDSPYASSTIVEIALDELKDQIDDPESSERSLDDALRLVENKLADSRQKFPRDAFISKIEANLAQLLKDHDRATEALRRAYSENNRDPYLAMRLSAIYEIDGDIEKAESILRDAVGRLRSNKQLHFALAELLRQQGTHDSKVLAYYYKRAFSPRDGNYQAQFWYARYLYEGSDKKEIEEANEIFSYLKGSRNSFETKTLIRDYKGDEGSPTILRGAVATKGADYCFIKADGSGIDYYCPIASISDDIWGALQEGDRLSFKVGFNYGGPQCLDVTMA